MQTPEAAMAQIRTLINGASPEVHAALAVADNYSFNVPTVLMRGRLS